MTEREALEILRAHNEWRRDDGDAFEPIRPPMVDPRTLGEAIDVACRVLAERAA